MKNLLYRLAIDEDGPTAVEYAVMLALIMLTCLGAVATLGQATTDSLDNSADEIINAIGP